MVNQEKMIKSIEGTNPGRYRMSYDEMTVLVNKYNGDLFMCIWATFRYGFIKGQRAASNKIKKEGAANV